MTPVMTRAEARIRNDRIVAMYEAGHTTAEIASIMRLSGSEFVREILTQRGVAFEPVESPHAKRMNAWRKATEGARMTLDGKL